MPFPSTDVGDRRCARIALALAALLLCPSTAAAAAQHKPVHTKLTAADERGAIDVKFVDGSDVRLRGGRLVSNGRIAALDDLVARFPGLRFSRLFASSSEARLATARRQAIDRSYRAQADMNLYFRVHTRSAADTVALLDALNALDMVELAGPGGQGASAAGHPQLRGEPGLSQCGVRRGHRRRLRPDGHRR